MVPGDGAAEATIVSRRARPLLVVVGGGATALGVGLGGAQAEAEAKTVSSVALLVEGLGAVEGVGMSFESNLSNCDTVPLMAVPLLWCCCS
jgi:hypothetical protein